MRTRVMALALAGTVALAVAAVLLVAAGGSVESYGGRTRTVLVEQQREAPAWTRPCWREVLDDSRSLESICSRVRGRVAFVERVDPDGDGDAKYLVLVPSGVVVVKVAREDRPARLPGIGDEVVAVGPVVRARLGLRELHRWGP